LPDTATGALLLIVHWATGRNVRPTLEITWKRKSCSRESRDVETRNTRLGESGGSCDLDADRPLNRAQAHVDETAGAAQAAAHVAPQAVRSAGGA